jgi:hypothetical protein
MKNTSSLGGPARPPPPSGLVEVLLVDGWHEAVDHADGTTSFAVHYANPVDGGDTFYFIEETNGATCSVWGPLSSLQAVRE